MVLVFGFCLRLSSVNAWPVQEDSWLCKGPCGCHGGSLPRAGAAATCFGTCQELRGCLCHSD